MIPYGKQDISQEDIDTVLAVLKSWTVSKVKIPFNFGGEPCDMEATKRLSDKFGFKIIEDASHAISVKYLDFPIGSCEFSEISVSSFHPVKIITSG